MLMSPDSSYNYSSNPMNIYESQNHIIKSSNIINNQQQIRQGCIVLNNNAQQVISTNEQQQCSKNAYDNYQIADTTTNNLLMKQTEPDLNIGMFA